MEMTDERLARIEAKLDSLKNFMADRLHQTDGRFDRLDRHLDRMDQRFLWMLGAQFTTLLAIMAGLFSIVTQLIRAS